MTHPLQQVLDTIDDDSIFDTPAHHRFTFEQIVTAIGLGSGGGCLLYMLTRIIAAQLGWSF